MEEQPREACPRNPGEVHPREGGDAVGYLPRNLLRVPAVKQRTDFSCGNAATLAVLRYWRWEAYERVDEAALYLPLETSHARGTEPEPIAAFLDRAGLGAEYRHSDVTVADLERAVDVGQPPIVDLQAWRDHDAPWRDVWDAGHYVVLVGYDDDRLFFMDPSTMTPGPYAYLPRLELSERWHDLTGEHDVAVERMAIFVRGAAAPRAMSDSIPERATRLR